jgi:hypothetical protein
MTAAMVPASGPLPARREEWDALSPSDRKLLTPEALARWTSDLADEDYSLAEIVMFERRRRGTLQTLRQGAELTDMEWKLLRYLQRNEGRNVSYLRIARHLWGSPANPITPATLRSGANVAYEAPLIRQIQTYVYKLRQKIEIDPLRPQHLANIRGVGYRWYSRPPSADDGENYERRAIEIERDRAEMQAVLGITEGEFTVVEARDRDGRPFETRVWFGPEHPDGQRPDGGTALPSGEGDETPPRP